MKIVFYSQDDSIERMVKSLGGELHFVREDQEVLEILEDVDEDEDCLLFLDMDIGKKKVELLNKSLVQNEWLYRIIISGEMKVKDFKKHQKSKTAAQGYVLKPLTPKVFKGILNDLEISHMISEGDLFEEGQALPSLPVEPQSVTGWSEDSEVFEDDDDNDISQSDFQAAEFKMNTQVRKLVDLHSVSGDRPPYEGELNDKIQQKFDQVFGENISSFSEESFNEGTQESIDFRQDSDLSHSSDGPALDLSLGEEATELKMDATTDDLSFDGDDELGVEAEDINLGDDIDLEAELDLSEDQLDDSLEGNEELLADGGDDMAIDLDEEEIDLDEELSFDEAQDEAPIESSNDDIAEVDLSDGTPEAGSLDFSDELEELTANRQLPSKEELSEFDEETGDIALPSNEEFSEVEASTDEDLSMTQDGNDNFDLDIDELQEEDVLEFDTASEAELPEEEGALSFSDNSEAELSDPEENSDDGGELDFSLGEDDGDLDLSEDAPVVSEPIEAQEQSDDFDLGDDAVLMADEVQASEELDFSMDDEPSAAELEPTEEPNEDEQATTSSFSGDELSFDDDDEIEKTMAINIAEVEKGGMNLEKAFEDDAEDDDLDLAGESEVEEVLASEELEPLEADEELSFSGDEDESLETSSEVDLDMEMDEGDTNPTMVMSEEMTQDLENMLDDEVVTKEFRPGAEDSEDDASLEEIDMDDDSVDFSESDDEEFEVEDEQTVEFDSEEISAELLEPEVSKETIQEDTPRQKAKEGHLSITAEADRIPPSFNESEAVRLQATIRQLREEREGLLKEINDLNRDKKLTDQDNLGLKAELDEAKIEISILKKRHSNETDEMKYRLRLSDEKKLFAEEKARTLQKEFDRLQQKVRIDFNQIKQREKELESQLELVKMDSEGQVQSRDKKILDLKRNIDQLEFNMENVVIREQKSRDDKVKVEERLERIMKTPRGSIEVLEDDMEWQDDKRKS
jgi:hypothetical protein